MNDREISTYIFLEDRDLRGDVAFVFGTRSWQTPVRRAVDLYVGGLVPKLIFSGGINEVSGINEARTMAEAAMRLGVPGGAILLEDKSANTAENVMFSKKVLEECIGFQDIHVITAVVKNYHARRALMTLRKHFPAHVIFRACPYSLFGFGRDDWHLSEKGRERVMEELSKIRLYLQNGEIAELED